MFQGTSFAGVTALGGVGLALRYPLLFTSVPPKHVYEVHIQLPASMGTKILPAPAPLLGFNMSSTSTSPQPTLAAA